MEPLEREQALEILEHALVAHVGMIDGEKPYVAPMSFVVLDDRILFRTMGGRKFDALQANPKVCIEVSEFNVDSGDWLSVIVEGVAEEIAADELKNLTVSLLLRKYESSLGSPLSRGGGLLDFTGVPHVIGVTLERISGMSSGGSWSHRTRPGRL